MVVLSGTSNFMLKVKQALFGGLVYIFSTESLILAQDERWRRA